MRWLLDSNVIIDHLDGKLSAALPEGALYYSVISESECLSRPDLDEDGVATVRDFLATMTAAELTEAVRAAAIVVRRSRAVKLPDAIILATAQVLGATLLTNDDRLFGFPGVSVAPIARAS